MVHTEAIASTTYLVSITGARETAVGGGCLCATVDDVVAAVTFLIPFETGVVEILTVTEVDTVFDGHVRGTGIGGACESSTRNVIPAEKQ